MKRLTLEQEALRVVDYMVSDDLSEICCFNSSFNRKFSQAEAKAMADKITHIYKISHSAIPEHSCFYVHDDWRKKTMALYKKLRRKKLIPISRE